MSPIKTTLTLAVIYLFSTFTISNEVKLVPNAAIKIDGNLTELAWEEASKTELNIEVWPGNNTKTTDEYKTTVHFFIDSKNLYIGVRATDPDPSKIRANYYKRDNSRGDDKIIISIDTFNQAQQAYVFSVNPLGGQSDNIALSREDVAWDGFWESKGHITSFGYELEMVISLNNFRSPDTTSQTWKMNFKRTLQREDSYVYSDTPEDRDNDCIICQYQKYQLSKTTNRNKDIQFRPYAITTRESVKDYPYSNSFEHINKSDLGLDVKWSPTDSQIVNLTINPDFSQVEADDAQFSVNRRFSAYYSEKRTFFLEGEEYFNSSLSLIHTRNLVEPDHGVKYTNKSGNHVYGAFYVRDSATNFIAPGLFNNEFISLNNESDNFVFRYKNEFNNAGNIGFLSTNRKSSDYENSVNAVDGFYRLDNTKRVSFQYAESKDTFLGNKTSGNASNLTYNYNDATDWHWLSYSKIEDDFKAGLGFITQVGFEYFNAGIGHLWDNGKSDGFWNRIYLSTSLSVDKPLDFISAGTETLYEYKSIELNIDGKNKLEAYITPSTTNEFYDGITHKKNNLYLSINYEIFNNVTAGISNTSGDGIDYSDNKLGDSRDSSIWMSAVLSSQFSLAIEYLKSKLDYQKNNVFDADIINFTANYSLDFNHHLRLKYQTEKISFDNNYSLDEISSGLQFLYLYQMSAYSSVYIGYSTNYLEDQTIGKLEEYNNYAFLKFNHVFTL